MASETEVIEAIVSHVQESYDLAMDSEDIPQETRNKIHDTVSDAVGNNYDTLADEIESLNQ